MLSLVPGRSSQSSTNAAIRDFLDKSLAFFDNEGIEIRGMEIKVLFTPERA